ncbi:MAG: hypothetical protein REV36_01535 [Burkholderia sp.]|nr:hypothetical protein [Burkholderia sp.]
MTGIFSTYRTLELQLVKIEFVISTMGLSGNIQSITTFVIFAV